MKICYFGNQLGFISGSHRYVLGLAKRFAAEGHEITVVTKGRDRRVSTLDGIRYEAVALEPRETFLSYFVEFPLKSLAYFARHQDFDIIHSMASYHRFAALARGVGLVSRTPIVYGVVSPAGRALNILGFDRLICASKNIRERLGPAAVFIPHHVDVASFQTDARYDFGNRGGRVVGSMGTPASRRGYDHLVRAIPLVLERHPDTRFVLAVVHPQIRYRPRLQRKLDRLRRLIESLGVSENVQLVGEVDVPRFLKSLDVFVYAVQTTKGMVDIPPTVLECLAAGCALVTTRQGGIPEVIRDGENGLLVAEEEADDPEAYAQRIVELIGNDPLRRFIQKNARECAEPFDVGQIAPQVMRVYEDVVSGRGR